jgi:hypothetical protein
MSSKLKIPLIRDETISSNKGDVGIPNIIRLRNLLRAQKET